MRNGHQVKRKRRMGHKVRRNGRMQHKFKRNGRMAHKVARNGRLGHKVKRRTRKRFWAAQGWKPLLQTQDKKEEFETTPNTSNFRFTLKECNNSSILFQQVGSGGAGSHLEMGLRQLSRGARAAREARRPVRRGLASTTSRSAVRAPVRWPRCTASPSPPASPSPAPATPTQTLAASGILQGAPIIVNLRIHEKSSRYTGNYLPTTVMI